MFDGEGSQRVIDINLNPLFGLTNNDGHQYFGMSEELYKLTGADRAFTWLYINSSSISNQSKFDNPNDDNNTSNNENSNNENNNNQNNENTDNSVTDNNNNTVSNLGNENAGAGNVTNVSKSGMLPETGDTNESNLTVMGAIMLAFTSFLSFVGLKRRKN